MSLRLTLPTGDTLTLLDSDGERVTLESPRAFPPGTPLTGTAADGSQYQLKVRGCRRAADAAAFTVTGRFVNLSRTGREAILAAASSTRPRSS